MVRLALLGTQYEEQVSTNPGELRDIEVAWVGAMLDRFRAEAHGLRVDALVIDLVDDSAASLTAAEIRALVEACGAQLALVAYGFTTRSLLRELRGDHLRVMQSPVSLATVRAHLAFLVVKDLLRGPPGGATSSTCTCATPAGWRTRRQEAWSG